MQPPRSAATTPSSSAVPASTWRFSPAATASTSPRSTLTRTPTASSPNLDDNPDWRIESESETFEENGLKFRYVDYVRK